MKTKILLAAVAGALVLPAPMASQADVMSGMDFKISGRVSAAINRVDSDKPGESATTSLGTTTTSDDRTDSRITLSADRDTDFGTAGFKLERDWEMDGLTDNRHQYVYFGGDWGTFYMGNHGNPVGMGNGYDQSFFNGGGGRINGTDRHDGIGYTYSNGQFSLGVTLHGVGGDASATKTNAARIPGITDEQARTARESESAFLARVQRAARLSGITVPTRNMNEMDADYATRIRTAVNALTTTRTMVADRESLAAAGTRLAKAAGIPNPMGTGADNAVPNTGVVNQETDAQRVTRFGVDSGLKDAALTTYTAGLAQREGELDAAYEARMRFEAANTKASQDARIADETIDTTIIGASYDLGIGVKIGASYYKDNTENGRDSTSLMVSGAFNQFSYWVMFESASDARPNVPGDQKNDVDGYGVHLQYALSDADNVWFQYGAKDYDLAATADTTNTVLGYSHSFGGGATGIIEYYSNDVDDVGGKTNPDPSGVVISARVAF